MKKLLQFSIIQKTLAFAKTHKIISAVILIGLAWGGYALADAVRGDATETRYVLGAVERGTIISSISGTGQVSASNQVTINAKASGNVTSVNVRAGQKVASGASIASVDATEALFNLESARISYAELTTVDDRDIRDAQEAISDAEISLKDAQHNIRATLATMIADMSDTMFSLKEQFNRDGYLNNTNRFGLSQQSRDYLNRAESAWWDAERPLDDLLREYRTVSNSTSDETIEEMLLKANDVATLVSQAAKYSRDAVVYLRDREENNIDQANASYTAITGLVTTANNIVSSGINGRNSINNARRSLRDAQNAYDDLLAGPDTLSLRSEQLSLRQREQTYADHFVRAPFAGTIASVSVQRGETVGSNAAIATLITDQKIAEITLNEVDVVKVEVGQKATLTFDAVEDLTITGEVAEVDLTGTVSQGVVTYRVKIAFDTEDSRIRPGMTVNTSIITDVRQDTLMVAASAVRMQGGSALVQVFDQPIAETGGAQGILSASAPQLIPVEIGLSDDLNTEILSGLAEGDQIVTRTITSSGTQAATTGSAAPSLFGGGVGGGGGVRFQGGGGGGMMPAR